MRGRSAHFSRSQTVPPRHSHSSHSSMSSPTRRQIVSDVASGIPWPFHGDSSHAPPPVRTRARSSGTRSRLRAERALLTYLLARSRRASKELSARAALSLPDCTPVRTRRATERLSEPVAIRGARRGRSGAAPCDSPNRQDCALLSICEKIGSTHAHDCRHSVCCNRSADHHEGIRISCSSYLR